MAQEQVRKERREQENDPPAAVEKTAKAEKKTEEVETTDKVGDFLAEVDALLEENPEKFLEGYKQRGGE